MKHTDFPQRNKIVMPPVGQPGIEALHLRDEDGICTSVWEPSAEERELIAAGGVILLHVMHPAQGYPPCALTVQLPEDKKT